MQPGVSNLRDENEKNIKPNSHIRQPTQPLQRSNGSDYATREREHQQAHNEAQPLQVPTHAVRHLRDRLSVDQYDEAEHHDELNGLGDIDEVLHARTKQAEVDVGVVPDGEPVRVELHEYPP